MLKYIIKRLGISIVILFGVSVIIYSLVRMMPNDYVDNKYSAMLNQGTLTQDDIDRFKEVYGLFMPEAHLNIQVKDGTKGSADNGGAQTDISGVYKRNVKIKQHDVALENNTPITFVAGKYTNGKLTLELASAETGDLNLATIYKTEKIDGKDANVAVYNGKYNVTIKDGSFYISISAMTDDLNASGEYRNAITPSGESAEYTLATGWEKCGAILSGYFTWVGNLLKGDLGRSFRYEKPVSQVIGENMWISFAIALIATILQFLISIPLGISSATHQYTFRDYTVTVLTMIGLSLPTYFFAAIVVKFFAVDLGWFPVSGLVSTAKTYNTTTFVGFISKFGDILHHLFLPILVNVILSLGGLMRYTRTNMLEVLNSDYIRTARAKGLSEKTVIYKHAFRNTLIPLATLLAGILPSLFGGMMITETVFSIDGIGRLAYLALREGDVPFVMGYNMFLAILTVLGTLFSDIMYSVVDPRVKLGD